ncbi:MAG TPA: 23S rRNA (pseudouridine(1915)-N(3))-methyltransferase RlmH [Burkholderiaceae bacterium]|nr:23S rRNA (pseudouridine(1915)-N(3))-methyltransferase RlmH [Burkholderiaceae bacterium]
MKLTIVAVGQRQPAWVDDAVADYLARFPSDFEVRLLEVRSEGRSGQAIGKTLAAEAQRLQAAIAPGTVVVALDELGKDWTTVRFAQQLQKWRDASERVAFLIGGPDGLDPELKRAATLRLRLSSLTLPHALARVLLAEQLYRVWSILAHHPYHRA